MITIQQSQLDKLKQQFNQHPAEVSCGVLLGFSEGNDKVISSLEELENEISENRKNRYLISPEQYIKIEKSAIKRDLDIHGFYYIKISGENIPSEFDKKNALLGCVYLIASADLKNNLNVKAFTLSDNRKSFNEEKIEIVSETAKQEYTLAV